MNRQIYKMTLSDASDSITFYLLEVPIADDDITGTARNTTIDGNVYEDYLWLKKQWSQKWSIMCKDEYDKLRGIWKRQYTDSEVVSVKYFYGDNIYTDGEVEGNTVQINNDSEVYEGEIRGFSLYGNAEQKTLSGKNLADLVPMTNGTITGANHATVETINDSTLGRQVIHITATSSYPTAKYMLPARLESGCYYALTLRYKTAYTGTGNEIQQALWVAPNWSGNSWDMIGSWQHAKNESGTTDPVAKVPQSSTWKVATFRFYADPTQYAYASASYTFIALSLGYGISAQNTSKEAWFADIMLTKITQAEWNATTYKDEEFEKYVGGIPSPNPDYPQEIKTVSGAQTVKITGKNLLDNTAEPNFASGVSIASIPTGFRATNTTSGQFHYASFYTKIRVSVGQTWTMSAKMSPSASNNGRITVGLADIDGSNRTSKVYLDANGSKTFTIEQADMAHPYIFYFVYGNLNGTASANDYVDYTDVQLELNDQATTYEPYQAQSQEINLGKNICFESDVQTQTIFRCSCYTKDITGTSLVLSAITNMALPQGATIYTFVDGVDLHTSVGTYYQPSANTTGTGIANLAPIMAQIRAGSVLTLSVYRSGGSFSTISEAQIENGTQASPFSPYKTPIELAKISTYRDYIWNDNGTWKIHKDLGKVVLTGDASESWAYVSGAHARFQYSNNTIALEPSPSAVGAVVSDHFTASSTNDIYSGIDGKIGVHATIHQFWLSYLAITDLNDFKTWLSTHNTTVYYALATPTDTEITDAELVGQLNALLAGSLYKGLNNVFLIPSAGADGTMTLDYRIDYEKETVVQDTTPVLLDLTDDGIINACQCRQNVKITMRETVQ